MGEIGSRLTPKKVAASIEEVKKAFNTLSRSQKVGLRRNAEYWIDRLGKRSAGQTAQDMVQEAFTRYFEEGSRHWYPDSTHFYGSLLGTLRSIADEWKRKYEGENLRVEQVEERGLEIFVSYSTPESIFEKKLIFESLQDQFKQDRIVLNILEGIRAKLKRSDIQEYFGLTAKEYDAGKRRLDYFLQKKQNDG